MSLTFFSSFLADFPKRTKQRGATLNLPENTPLSGGLETASGGIDGKGNSGMPVFSLQAIQGHSNLPKDHPNFIGRRSILEEIIALLPKKTDPASPRVDIHVVGLYGDVGVGKSTLAIHAAHVLRNSFPEGQFYVDCSHYPPQTTQWEPSLWLVPLLKQFGVPEEAVPNDYKSQLALYTAFVRQKRFLIVFDGIQDEEMLKPFVVPISASSILATSRFPITAIPQSHYISVSVMGMPEGIALFESVLSTQRIQQDLANFKRLVAYCNFNPSLIQVAAKTLLKKAQWTPSSLMVRLEEAQEVLPEGTGNPMPLNAQALLAVSLEEGLRELEAKSTKALKPSEHLLSWSLLFGTRPFVPDMVSYSLKLSHQETDQLLKCLCERGILSKLDKYGTYYQFPSVFIQFFKHFLPQEAVADSAQTVGRPLVDYLLGLFLTPVESFYTANNGASPEGGFGKFPHKKQSEDPFFESFLFKDFVFKSSLLFNCLQDVRSSLTSEEFAKIVLKLETPLHQNKAWGILRSLSLQASPAMDVYGRRPLLAQLLRLQKISADNLELYEEALQKAEQEIQIYRELNEKAQEGKAYSYLGNLYSKLGVWKKSVQSYEKDLLLARELKDSNAVADIYHNIGVTFARQGAWGEAVKAYKKCLMVRQQLGDRVGEARTLEHIAMLYANQKRWLNAVQYLGYSLAIYKDIKAPLSEAACLSQMGIVYSNAELWYEAIETYRQALDVLRKMGPATMEDQGDILNNLASVYTSNGLWEEAIRCYEDDLLLCQQLKDIHGEGQTLTNMGLIYAKHGHWIKAQEFFHLALTRFHAGSEDYQQLQTFLQQRQLTMESSAPVHAS